ncbi:MAG: hypothetical protein V5804_03665 [Mucilaginibacter sp.]|uniref:hypothetical protein n=1 Tax=Mucilaginibacter sp. TaxID=1882438 RepID=UPI0034E40636
MINSLDDHYPLITKEALHHLILASSKLQGTVTIGTTIAYILTGKRALSKRTHLLRETDGLVGFNHATGICICFGCMTGLLKWYEDNRNWKDGGYFK